MFYPSKPKTIQLKKSISIQIGTLHDITDLKTIMASVDTLDDT